MGLEIPNRTNFVDVGTFIEKTREEVSVVERFCCIRPDYYKNGILVTKNLNFKPRGVYGSLEYKADAVDGILVDSSGLGHMLSFFGKFNCGDVKESEKIFAVLKKIQEEEQDAFFRILYSMHGIAMGHRLALLSFEFEGRVYDSFDVTF